MHKEILEKAFNIDYADKKNGIVDDFLTMNKTWKDDTNLMFMIITWFHEMHARISGCRATCHILPHYPIIRCFVYYGGSWTC
ncbi:unnamed protein product [Rhizophagus irregularis]|nr:unnamed protein product [Rhizophagus irregularis]